MVRAPPVLLVPTAIIYLYLITMIIAAAAPEIRLMKATPLVSTLLL